MSKVQGQGSRGDATALQGTQARSAAADAFKGQSLPTSQKEVGTILRGGYRSTQPPVSSEIVPSSQAGGVQTTTYLPKAGDTGFRITTTGASPAQGPGLDGDKPALVGVDIRPPNARFTVREGGNISAGAVAKVGDVQVQGRVNANAAAGAGQPVSGSGSVTVPVGNNSALVFSGRSTIVSNDGRMNSGAGVNLVFDPNGPVKQRPFGGPDGVFIGGEINTSQRGSRTSSSLGINLGASGIDIGGPILDASVGASINDKGQVSPAGGAAVTFGSLSTTKPSSAFTIGVDATPEAVEANVGVKFSF